MPPHTKARSVDSETHPPQKYIPARKAPMGQRTTRAKLMSYLSAEAQRRGEYEFDISFSRQQLADYLGVERSGLSLELGKMRAEGLLDFQKNHFVLKV